VAPKDGTDWLSLRVGKNFFFGFSIRNMKPIGCPEKSVRNYHYSLRNNPEQRSSPFLQGGNLKSRIAAFQKAG
jgi:hypothetical protein